MGNASEFSRADSGAKAMPTTNSDEFYKNSMRARWSSLIRVLSLNFSINGSQNMPPASSRPQRSNATEN